MRPAEARTLSWRGLSWNASSRLAVASALSAAGLGLLIWLGISVALLQGGSAEIVLLRSMQKTGLWLACVLALCGVFALRAAPSNAAGGKWRKIGAVTLALALVAAAALIALLTGKNPDPGWVGVAAMLLAMSAVCAVLAAGMGMAARGRATWRPQMVAPNFLAYALLAGAALLFAVIALKWPGQGLLSAPAPSLIMLLVVMAALKLMYWFENGGLRAPVEGLPDADSLRLRLLVLALLALVPLLLAAMLFLWPALLPRLGWCLIALSVLAGGMLERQLLLAEAGGARPG
jgi:hypothetical protein